MVARAGFTVYIICSLNSDILPVPLPVRFDKVWVPDINRHSLSHSKITQHNTPDPLSQTTTNKLSSIPNPVYQDEESQHVYEEVAM